MSARIKLSKKELLYLEAQKSIGNLSLRKYNRINILLLHRGKRTTDVSTLPDGDRVIRFLETPVEGTDAVNKDYVDAAVSAGGGGG